NADSMRRIFPYRYMRVKAPAESDKLDETQLATWIGQVASISGWDGGSTVDPRAATDPRSLGKSPVRHPLTWQMQLGGSPVRWPVPRQYVRAASALLGLRDKAVRGDRRPSRITGNGCGRRLWRIRRACACWSN